MGETQGSYDRGLFEGKVLAELEAIKKLDDAIKDCLEKQSDRITKLEMDLARAKTLAVVLGAISGTLVTFVVEKIPLLPKLLN